MDPETIIGSLPYTCVACGGAMRTRGIDGRCFRCFSIPPLRCTTCHRVRFQPDQHWEDHPGTVPGETPVTCLDCARKAREERQRELVREDKRLLKQREKGYGEPAPGVDVFKNFRT